MAAGDSQCLPGDKARLPEGCSPSPDSFLILTLAAHRVPPTPCSRPRLGATPCAPAASDCPLSAGRASLPAPSQPPGMGGEDEIRIYLRCEEASPARMPSSHLGPELLPVDKPSWLFHTSPAPHTREVGAAPAGSFAAGKSSCE